MMQWFNGIDHGAEVMTTGAYFIRPDGKSYLRVSLGGYPLTFKEPMSHPSLKDLAAVNPDVTHVEYWKTQPEFYGAPHHSGRTWVVYIFGRALKMIGPQADERYEEVRLQVSR
jgi:hypothetical protein